MVWAYSEEADDEMVTTRSMTRKQNHQDAPPRRKKAKASNNGGWSNLHHDVLFLIMMRLGVVDFLAFSGVCQSWRELAIPNRCRFMASRCPMSIYLSMNSKKSLVCHLDDFNGRKFKTVLPATSARACLGLTSGYLILFARRNRDFLLMNPVTRHQLRFPSYPYYVSTDVSKIRAVLVFSPSLSRWVFLIAVRYSKMISFSLDGGRSVWKHLVCRSPISDVHVFRGKIYALDVNRLLYVARLDQLRSTLMPIEFKNCADSQLVLPEFVSSSENMFVMGCIEGESFMFQEVDFVNMEWIYPDSSEEEHTLFLGEPKCAVAIKPSSWDVSQKRFKLSAYLYRDYEKNRRKAGLYTGHSWYFPHDCFNVNLLEE